jgi:hypothetical protein
MTHHRVSEGGQKIGRATALAAERGHALLASKGLVDLNLPGVRDEMCASCACRAGTVPNGCLQTQLDFIKSVVQGDRFCCHAPRDGRLCAGWIAARAYFVKNPMPEELQTLIRQWEYSPPDEVTA